HRPKSRTSRRRTPAANAWCCPDQSKWRDYHRDDCSPPPCAESSHRPAIREDSRSSQRCDRHFLDRPPPARNTWRPHRIHSCDPNSPPDHPNGKFHPCHPPPQSLRKLRSDQPEKPPPRSFPYQPSAAHSSTCSTSRQRHSIYKL